MQLVNYLTVKRKLDNDFSAAVIKKIFKHKSY
jgi:hypothetical protein